MFKGLTIEMELKGPFGYVYICAMAESLQVSTAFDKRTKYQVLIPQMQALIDPRAHFVANSGNLLAALRQTFGWWWIGVYMIRNGKLELGPFQGPIACTVIERGKGVCGSSWEKAQTLLVPDVDLFPGHIACSSASRSEIVVPIFKNNEIIGVLDADSEHLNHFDEVDQQFLEQIAVLFADCYA